MAQDGSPTDQDQDRTRYAALGDEVALVLASARDAAVEMREQAKQYAESLLASTRQEIEDMLATARHEAERVVQSARADGDDLLLQARRQVLAIIEAARSRVEEADRAAAEAAARRDDLLTVESHLESSIEQLLDGARHQLDALRSRRDASAPAPNDLDPSAALDELLAERTAGEPAVGD